MKQDSSSSPNSIPPQWQLPPPLFQWSVSPPPYNTLSASTKGELLPFAKRIVFAQLSPTDVSPSLVYAFGATIYIHSHQAGATSDSVKQLNIQQEVTMLDLFRPKNLSYDQLIICTEQHALLYDVHENMDMFYKEVHEKIGSVCCTDYQDEQVVILGTDCAIQGYGPMGEDLLWNVASDRVCALSPFGKDCLIIGTEDSMLTILKEDEVSCEILESDFPVGLLQLSANTFFFVLKNGEYGVYKNGNRIWKQASTSQIVSFAWVDINGDERNEIVLGFAQNGWCALDDQTGKVIYETNLPPSQNQCSSIAATLTTQQPEIMLIIIYVNGDVVAYPKLQPLPQANCRVEQKSASQIMELLQKKRELSLELQQMKEKVGQVVDGDETGLGTVIPVDTVITADVQQKGGSLVVEVQSNNDTVIRVVELSGEAAFDADKDVHVPSKAVSALSIPLEMKRDGGFELNITVHYGAHVSEWCRIIDLKYKMPAFSYFQVMQEPFLDESHFVHYELRLPPNGLSNWISNHFMNVILTDNTFDLSFLWLRDQKSQFRIKSISDDQRSYFIIYASNLEIVSRLIQSLYTKFSVLEAEPQAICMPNMVQHVCNLSETIRSMYNVRQRLQNEMADMSNDIKVGVVQAEDARTQRDMKMMLQSYSSVVDMNQHMMDEYKKRETQHIHLVGALKELNSIISASADLRAGEAKTNLVTQCRNLIKSNQLDQLHQFIGLK